MGWSISFQCRKQKNAQVVFEDLTQKLKEVYGEPYFVTNNIDKIFGEVDFARFPSDWKIPKNEAKNIQKRNKKAEKQLNYVCFRSKLNGNMIILYHSNLTENCDIYYLLSGCDDLIENTLKNVLIQLDEVPEGVGSDQTDGL